MARTDKLGFACPAVVFGRMVSIKATLTKQLDVKSNSNGDLESLHVAARYAYPCNHALFGWFTMAARQTL